jgi:bacterioferritin-associated ferredoxin
MCRVVTRKVIEAVIADGARTVDEVSQLSGAGTDCGKCRRSISRLLELEMNAPQSNAESFRYTSS